MAGLRFTPIGSRFTMVLAFQAQESLTRLASAMGTGWGSSVFTVSVWVTCADAGSANAKSPAHIHIPNQPAYRRALDDMPRYLAWPPADSRTFWSRFPRGRVSQVWKVDFVIEPYVAGRRIVQRDQARKSKPNRNAARPFGRCGSRSVAVFYALRRNGSVF